MIQICFLRTELTQTITINEQKKVRNTDFDNDSHHETDVKRPQISSNDLKRPQSASNENSKKTRTKNNLQGGSVQENIELDEHYLDKDLQNINS